MYAHHEHLLVVGAVEDADLATLREALRVAPQEIVIELLGRWHLEAVHRDALRVHPAHHVADRAVLSGGVQRLQHHQHPPRVLSSQPGLVLREQAHPLGEQGDSLLLLYAALEGRVEVLGEDHLRPGLNPERLDELRDPSLTLVGHPQSNPMHQAYGVQSAATGRSRQ